jgi:hypothetical protein
MLRKRLDPVAARAQAVRIACLFMAKTRRLVSGNGGGVVEVLKGDEVIARTKVKFDIYREYDDGVPVLIYWEGQFLGHRDEFDPWDHMGADDMAIRMPGEALIGPILMVDIGGTFQGNGPPPMPLPEG